MATKKILTMVSENGFWCEELLLPKQHLEAAGYTLQFVTPTGKLPFPDGASLDPSYVDPPLGKPVTSPAMADLAKSQNWEEVFANRMSLEDMFPVRPYLSGEKYLRELEVYYRGRDKGWEIIEEYDALLMVGGSGPIADMVNNPRLHDLILGFYYADKPIAAECYAVTCIAFAREFDTRSCILRGKHVTGHTLEYDYTSGWSMFINGDFFSFGAPPFPLEYILRDAVGPEGRFVQNVGRDLSAVVDYPFITSRSVASSDLCGRLLVDVLTKGLRRYGW